MRHAWGGCNLTGNDASANGENEVKLELSTEAYERLLQTVEESGDESLLQQISVNGYQSDEHLSADVTSDQPLDLVFETDRGEIYRGDSLDLLRKLEDSSVDLILTSPPFALVDKKEYGNEPADEYIDWFRPFAKEFHRVLKPRGSVVIDLGGSWEKGQPTRSLYHFEFLLDLVKNQGFHLCQEFYWYNPAKLPTPAEWVTIRRIRVKDAVNCVWWLSPTPYPEANNRRVLQPYKDSMEKLFEDGYTEGPRPSGHNISDEFDNRNGGAIPPNLIALANTGSKGPYLSYCDENDIEPHPARFPKPLPGFFIRMLTDQEDLVLDPFAGSCVTGEVAEVMDRRWKCCEIHDEYIQGGIGRFEGLSEDASTPHAESTREKPYLLSPPVLSQIEEEDAPLPPHGGEEKEWRGRPDGE